MNGRYPTGRRTEDPASARYPTGRRTDHRWRNCRHPSVHLTAQRTMIVLSPILLSKLGREPRDPIEICLCSGQPGEIIPWHPDHLPQPSSAPVSLPALPTTPAFPTDATDPTETEHHHGHG